MAINYCPRRGEKERSKLWLAGGQLLSNIGNVFELDWGNREKMISINSISQLEKPPITVSAMNCHRVSG